MPTANSNIVFKYGLKANYVAAEKDLNTIYFCTDTQQMFVGETEYTRPVAFGAALPNGFVPPNSLFYKTGTKELFFSEGGTKWTACSNFYEHPAFTAYTLGQNTVGQLAFGGKFKVPSITTDTQGHVTAGEDIEIQLPAAPEDIKNTVTVTGEGNAITAAEFDAAGHALTLTKGEKFATSKELTDAIGKITSFGVDAGPDGTGYASLTALKTEHPEGTTGIFYLVKAGKTSTSNVYAEYFWTGSAYEKAGEFGDVDLSDYVLKTTTVNGHALDADITLDKTDVGLDKVDNTADADKAVKSATVLATARKIAIAGDATGEATFDGSADVSINVDVNEATKATQDGAGNVIADTYATKDEVTAAALKWQTF